MRRRKTLARGLLVLIGLTASIAAKQQLPGLRPTPDRRDVRYGEGDRNLLDFWRAPVELPTPLVVYIHGGGFRSGDKAGVPPALLRGCLDSGISVASINYTLSEVAPFPSPMEDGARAVQFLRAKATAWGVDPDRIGASGGSAGAGIALWIGLRDDLADPIAEDPVLRQSSRLDAIAVVGAQTSYDPRTIAKVVGGRAHEHPALRTFYGLEDDQVDSPEAQDLYERASPDRYVSADDPPVLLIYSESPDPLPDDARPGRGIHHPKFGDHLKAMMDAFGVECRTIHTDDLEGGPTADDAEVVAFFREHFGPEADSVASTNTEDDDG